MNIFRTLSFLSVSKESRTTRRLKELSNNPKSLSSVSRSEASKLLKEAVRTGYKEFVELLHRHSVDVDPLQLAIARGDVISAESLLRDNHTLNWDSDTLTKCIFWRKSTRKDLLTLLLGHGWSNSDGDDLLLQFVIGYADQDQDSVDVARILIESGWSPNVRSKVGWTPLQACVTKVNINFVELLIDSGADVNAKGFLGRTALHQVTDEDIFNLLVSKGADVNARDVCGYTPLHTACLHCNYRVVELLLRRGAQISARNHNGETPFSTLQTPKTVNYVACIRAMVKEFAILAHDRDMLCADDVRLLHEHPRIRSYFQKCVNELDEKEGVRFYRSYSYGFVMRSRSVRRLSYLVKNEEFVAGYKDNLRKFCFYQNYLRRILNEAVRFKDRCLIVEARLSDIFKEFLPEVVIRKLAENLTVDNLPLEKYV